MFAALVPMGVVTRTLAVPAVPAGVVAVIVVALTTVKLVAATPPKVTAMVPVRLVPAIVTLVPPSVLPLAGVRSVRGLGLMLGLYIPPYLDAWYRHAARMIGG